MHITDEMALFIAKKSDNHIMQKIYNMLIN